MARSPRELSTVDVDGGADAAAIMRDALLLERRVADAKLFEADEIVQSLTIENASLRAHNAALRARLGIKGDDGSPAGLDSGLRMPSPPGPVPAAWRGASPQSPYLLDTPSRGGGSPPRSAPVVDAHHPPASPSPEAASPQAPRAPSPSAASPSPAQAEAHTAITPPKSTTTSATTSVADPSEASAPPSIVLERKSTAIHTTMDVAITYTSEREGDGATAPAGMTARDVQSEELTALRHAVGHYSTYITNLEAYAEHEKETATSYLQSLHDAILEKTRLQEELSEYTTDVRTSMAQMQDELAELRVRHAARDEVSKQHQAVAVAMSARVRATLERVAANATRRDMTADVFTLEAREMLEEIARLKRVIDEQEIARESLERELETTRTHALQRVRDSEAQWAAACDENRELKEIVEALAADARRKTAAHTTLAAELEALETRLQHRGAEDAAVLRIAADSELLANCRAQHAVQAEQEIVDLTLLTNNLESRCDRLTAEVDAAGVRLRTAIAAEDTLRKALRDVAEYHAYVRPYLARVRRHATGVPWPDTGHGHAPGGDADAELSIDILIPPVPADDAMTTPRAASVSAPGDADADSKETRLQLADAVTGAMSTIRKRWQQQQQKKQRQRSVQRSPSFDDSTEDVVSAAAASAADDVNAALHAAQAMRCAVDGLAACVARSDAQIASWASVREQMEHDHARELSRVAAEREQVRQALAEAQQELEEARAQVAALIKENDTMATTLASWNEMEQALKGEIEALAAERAQLLKEMQQQHQRIAALEAAAIDARTLRDENNALRCQISRLNDAGHAHADDAAVLQRTAEELEAERSAAAALREELGRLQGRVDELVAEVALSARALGGKEHEQREMTDELVSVRTIMSEMRAQHDERVAALDAARAATAAAQSECDVLQRTLSERNTALAAARDAQDALAHQLAVADDAACHLRGEVDAREGALQRAAQLEAAVAALSADGDEAMRDSVFFKSIIVDLVASGNEEAIARLEAARHAPGPLDAGGVVREENVALHCQLADAVAARDAHAMELAAVRRIMEELQADVTAGRMGQAELRGALQAYAGELGAARQGLASVLRHATFVRVMSTHPNLVGELKGVLQKLTSGRGAVRAAAETVLQWMQMQDTRVVERNASPPPPPPQVREASLSPTPRRTPARLTSPERTQTASPHSPHAPSPEGTRGRSVGRSPPGGDVPRPSPTPPAPHVDTQPRHATPRRSATPQSIGDRLARMAVRGVADAPAPKPFAPIRGLRPTT